MQLPRVEIDTGVKAGDQVVLNPPVNLVDGSKVQARLEGVRIGSSDPGALSVAYRILGPGGFSATAG
jgi:hypothetical protein